jgi:hypothetical protein
MQHHRRIAIAIGMTLAVSAYAADWGGLLKGALGKPGGGAASAPAATGVDALNPAEVGAGLKEALVRGAEAAVAKLGKPDGFFGNPALRIPLPENLKKAEKAMRMFGMGQEADQLTLAMNRAAEAAVPEARTLLVDAVKDMSVEDAKGVLTGGDTAATDFFRKKTEQKLRERFAPIVKATTDQVGLAQQYNTFAGLAARFGAIDKRQATIEQYVTQQSLDRLYKVIGEEERAIRANPVAAGSDLIRKVFGAVMGR